MVCTICRLPTPIKVGGHFYREVNHDDRRELFLKRWQLWLGILISAVFMWYALRGLHLQEVWAALQAGNYWWLIPSVAVYFVAVWARTWRWDYMLRPLKKISVRRLFPVVVIGYMGNNIYPFRAGELLRSYVLYRRENVAVSASLATVVVERIFDGLVMLVFVFVALPLLPNLPDWVRSMVIIASLAFFGALIIFFAVAAAPSRAYQMAVLFSRLFLIPFLALARVGLRLAAAIAAPAGALPGSAGRFMRRQSARLSQALARTMQPDALARAQAPILGFAERFLTGLESLRSFRNVLMIFFTSLLIWLLETLKYWFVMHAFPFEVSFFALMLMNGIVNLATTLPSAPGYIGTFDLPGIKILNELYRVPAAVATAYTLVLHAALWLPITLLGGYYMLREGLRWADFERAGQVSEGEAVA